jgi:hypothetical protein
MVFVVYGVLALVLYFAGYFFFLGARNIWRGLASPHWPKVAGMVTTSDTTSAATTDSKTLRTSIDYAANIVFRYNVNGRDYTTKLLYFGQTEGSGDPTEAQLRHLRYPMGAQVNISYNPGDPAIAAAETGFHAESLWLLMAGLIFGLPCIMAGVIVGTSDSSMRDNTGMAIGAGIFASIFAMAGIAALTIGLINLWRGHASENWPKVAGTITYQTLDSEMVDVQTIDPQTLESSRTVSDKPTYSDHLVFVYEVDGKKRYSNTRRFGLMAGGAQDEAETMKARYPQGKAVTVSYSPDNPNLGVLEPGIDSEAYIVPGIGVAVLLFVLAICVFMIPSMLRPFGR